MSDIMIKPVGKRLSAAFFMRWLSVMLFALACHEAVAAQQGIVTSTSAGANVTAGKYGVLMSLGQAGQTGTVTSSRYQLLAGYVPATLLPPESSPPTSPEITGASEDQAFQVDVGDLATLLAVSNPDGLNYQLHITPNTGVLRQSGSIVATVTLGQTGSVNWVPPANQNGSINALSVVMKRGEYPDSNAVSVSISVTAVNDPPIAVDDAASANEDESIRAMCSQMIPTPMDRHQRLFLKQTHKTAL